MYNTTDGVATYGGVHPQRGLQWAICRQQCAIHCLGLLQRRDQWAATNGKRPGVDCISAHSRQFSFVSKLYGRKAAGLVCNLLMLAVLKTVLKQLDG